MTCSCSESTLTYRVPELSIPINGNLYNGTATFKQATALYFNFLSEPGQQTTLVFSPKTKRRSCKSKQGINERNGKMIIKSTVPELYLSEMPVQDLLKSYAAIINELKNRKVLRTNNNPVADYTEWLVANSLRLTLAGNSSSGFDATAVNGVRFQIKGRRVHCSTKSVQLSAIRNLNKRPFDFLVAVVFESNFSIRHAVKMPIGVVQAQAVFQKHTNSHTFHISKSLLKDDRVHDISALLH